jgi:hypothetical protein
MRQNSGAVKSWRCVRHTNIYSLNVFPDVWRFLAHSSVVRFGSFLHYVGLILGRTDYSSLGNHAGKQK